jgi:oligopeptidase A
MRCLPLRFTGSTGVLIYRVRGPSHSVSPAHVCIVSLSCVWQPIINQILALKYERAQLLGMRHHADVSTASKMATFEGAMKLMEDLRAKSYDAAVKEMEELKAFAAKQGFEGKLMPWDMTYYAERMRESLYSYQEEDLRPYFSLPRVLDGLFSLVNRLFDVEIVAADGKAPVWDKDVRFFQINRNGEPAAYFYLDPYSVRGWWRHPHDLPCVVL